MPNEIVVYRNPGEKLIWDLILSGSAFPVMAACLVFVAAFVVSSQLLDGSKPFRKPTAIRAYGPWFVASLAAVITYLVL